MLIQVDLQKGTCTSVLEKLSSADIVGASLNTVPIDDGGDTDSLDSVRIDIETDKRYLLTKEYEGYCGTTAAVMLGLITAVNFFVILTCAILTKSDAGVGLDSVASDVENSTTKLADAKSVQYAVTHFVFVFPTIVLAFLCMILQCCTIGHLMKKYTGEPNLDGTEKPMAKKLAVGLALLIGIVLAVLPFMLLLISDGFPKLTNGRTNEPYTAMQTLGLILVLLPNPVLMTIMVWGCITHKSG